MPEKIRLTRLLVCETKIKTTTFVCNETKKIKKWTVLTYGTLFCQTFKKVWFLAQHVLQHFQPIIRPSYYIRSF